MTDLHPVPEHIVTVAPPKQVVHQCQWCGAVALVAARPEVKLAWLIEHDDCWIRHAKMTIRRDGKWITQSIGVENGN